MRKSKASSAAALLQAGLQQAGAVAAGQLASGSVQLEAALTSAATNRKPPALPPSLVAEKAPGGDGGGAEASDSEDEYILAVQQKVEGQLEILLIDFDLAVTDFWTFITNQENNPKDRVDIDAYRATLLPKAVELAETAQKILAEHQCTYLHDVVYGLWMGAGVIGAYLRASMEGFEHANKVFGAIMRQQVSMGGRGERHGMIQALVLRRATTNSRIADNKVNEYSKARAVGVTDASEKRRMSIESALDAMRELKRELDEIERVPMESSDALGELEKLKI